MLLPESHQYPNLSEDADSVGGQLRRDKECPFSGVTNSDSVWRKVPEIDARSVLVRMMLNVHRNHKAYQGRGESGVGGGGWGGGGAVHGGGGRGKVTGQCPQTTTFLKSKESRNGIEPMPFRLPA